MNCYKLFHSKHTIGFTLSPSKSGSVDACGTYRVNCYLDCEFTDDWQFTKKTKADLKKMYLLTNPVDLRELPDFWGNLSSITFKNDNGGPVAVSPKIQEILSELMPGRFETIPAGPIIDCTHGREIIDHDHVFVTFTDQRDTIDRNQNRITRETRYGTDIWYMRAPVLPVIDTTCIGDGVIWREALNGELFVSDLFKDAFESVGGKGLDFHPLSGSQ